MKSFRLLFSEAFGQRFFRFLVLAIIFSVIVLGFGETRPFGSIALDCILLLVKNQMVGELKSYSAIMKSRT